MNRDVDYPDAGFDVKREFDINVKCWRVYARPAGARWWTNCGLIGHAQMTTVDLDALAVDLASRWIGHGMVK